MAILLNLVKIMQWGVKFSEKVLRNISMAHKDCLVGPSPGVLHRQADCSVCSHRLRQDGHL